MRPEEVVPPRVEVGGLEDPDREVVGGVAVGAQPAHRPEVTAELGPDAPVGQVQRVEEPGEVERGHELVLRAEGEVGERNEDGRRREDQRGAVEEDGQDLLGASEKHQVCYADAFLTSNLFSSRGRHEGRDKGDPGDDIGSPEPVQDVARHRGQFQGVVDPVWNRIM